MRDVDETEQLVVNKATGLRKRKNARESSMVSFVANMLTICSAALPNCFAEVYVNEKVLRTKVVKGTLNPSWDDSFEVYECHSNHWSVQLTSLNQTSAEGDNHPGRCIRRFENDGERPRFPRFSGLHRERSS